MATKTKATSTELDFSKPAKKVKRSTKKVAVRKKATRIKRTSLKKKMSLVQAYNLGLEHGKLQATLN